MRLGLIVPGGYKRSRKILKYSAIFIMCYLAGARCKNNQKKDIVNTC